MSRPSDSSKLPEMPTATTQAAAAAKRPPRPAGMRTNQSAAATKSTGTKTSPPKVAGVKPAVNVKQPARSEAIDTLEKPARVEKAPKPAKPAKSRKAKLVRDSFTIPETEYSRITVLKNRLALRGLAVKKSELLRAGLAVLANFGDAELLAALEKIERVKTGRPPKAK